VKKPVKGKPVPKAKTKVHRKPVHVTPAMKAARHAAALKAAKSRAANAKKAKVHPRRKLALAGGVACCSAEALAASLRLAGAAVSDEDVLALYWRTASDPDAGATVLATLEAAAEFGLAAYRPARVQVFAPELAFASTGCNFPLILGLDLPGPHAVLDDGGDWWSWGERYDPASWPDAVIEEAWEVTWQGIR
jgi:hypothetical protein